MQKKTDGGPEWRDQKAGKHQPLHEVQAGNSFGLVPSGVNRMVCPMKFPQPQETPHNPYYTLRGRGAMAGWLTGREERVVG